MTASRLKVLMVEDSSLVSSRLSELLSNIPDVEVTGIVMTEKNAVHEILVTTPDVVVLDLRLKEGTGFGVLRSLKSMSKRPIVAVMTNYALPQYRAEAIRLGATYFLDKANEFEELPRILATQCDAKRVPLLGVINVTSTLNSPADRRLSGNSFLSSEKKSLLCSGKPAIF